MVTERDAIFSAAIDDMDVDAWHALSAAYLLAKPDISLIDNTFDLLDLAASIVWC